MQWLRDLPVFIHVSMPNAQCTALNLYPFFLIVSLISSLSYTRHKYIGNHLTIYSAVCGNQLCMRWTARRYFGLPIVSLSTLASLLYTSVRLKFLSPFTTYSILVLSICVCSVSLPGREHYIAFTFSFGVRWGNKA